MIVVKQHAIGLTWTHDVLFDGFAFRVHIDGPEAADVRNSAIDVWYVVGSHDLTCERLERKSAPAYATLDGERLVLAGCSDERIPVVHVGFLPRDASP
jgi:hypothetical protein